MMSFNFTFYILNLTFNLVACPFDMSPRCHCEAVINGSSNLICCDIVNANNVLNARNVPNVCMNIDCHCACPELVEGACPPVSKARAIVSR